LDRADDRKPVAEGDLSRTPFAHVLLYVHSNALSGTLVLGRTGFETKVVFREGKAVAAKPLPRGTELSRGLLELCVLETGRYAFWEGDLLGDAPEVVRGTVDPLMFLVASLKGHVRDSVVASVVDRFAGIPLKVVPEFDPHRFGLRGPDAGLVQALREMPMDPETAVARGRQGQIAVRRLLYLLLITKNAVPADGSVSGSSGVRVSVTPSGFPAARSSAPPPAEAASTRPSQRPSSPSNRAVDSRPGSPVPTTPRPSGAAALRTGSSLPAWKQLASMRPGQLGGSAPAGASTPASDRTGPPRDRRSSVPAMPVSDRPLGSAPRPSAAPLPLEALDTEGKLKRAEQLSQRKRHADAARILEGLLAEDDTNPDVHAARAWVLYQQLSGQASMRVVHDAAARALRLDATHPRALYVRGLAYKRDGREAEARASFRRVLETDPDHLEARRELRLARMRRRK